MNENPAFLFFLAISCSLVVIYMVLTTIRAIRYGIERKGGLPNITRHNAPKTFYGFIAWFCLGILGLISSVVVCVRELIALH